MKVMCNKEKQRGNFVLLLFIKKKNSNVNEVEGGDCSTTEQ